MSIHVKLLEVQGRGSPANIVTAGEDVRFDEWNAIYRAVVMVLMEDFNRSVYGFFCRYVYPFED
jgi:hypothetical protein